MTETVVITVKQPDGKQKVFRREFLRNSRIGAFFYPTGELGQVTEVTLKYSDGHTRNYRLEERVDPLAR